MPDLPVPAPDPVAPSVAGDAAEVERLRRSVRDRLKDGAPDAIAALFIRRHPADTALVLDRLTTDETCAVLRALPPALRSAVFGYFTDACQGDLARCLARREFADLVSRMSADERADLYNRLTEEQQRTLLPALAQAEREDIRRLAGYRRGTAGAVMTSEYATLTPGVTARDAIEQLRREAPDKETIYDAYVIDEDRRLLGVVSLRDLIMAEAEARVADFMVGNPIAAPVDTRSEEIAARIARYDLHSLPIIDGDGRLVGIVTQDDAMDVVEQEATEDFHRSATVLPLDGSVRHARLHHLYRKRVSWLVLLVFGNLLSGAGIALFEDTIAAHITLVFFLPLLIASGGNAGAQASTLMVRAIATGDVRMSDWSRMLGREIVVATALGVTMALTVSLIGVARGGVAIAGVVAATMVLVVLAGSLIGLSLPFILNRLKLDPATASGPLVTSIADVIGVVTYFAIATAVLPLGTGAGG
ncbi:magnesium transporter [Azospirillum halopraeferens]|uniref:magnesium transporter n=1 Tax=Azospirillum halopraeferens TaxID=34010 RepID=UPI0003F76531|nr:magnesium transporter [Azospirillum halopraeferens]